MDRKLNYLFLFLLVVVFITAASTVQQWHVILGLILSASFSFLAFLFRRLTLDGMFASIVAGIFILGLGGWATAGVVLLFFVSSVVITGESPARSTNSIAGIRRNGLQVWANGFWLMVCLVLDVVFNAGIFTIAAMGAIATATADTWATELGSKVPGATYLITDFKTVASGTDGGISLRGTTAALIGSGMIAIASIYFFSLEFYVFPCIFLAGFLGCIVDSYFGAIFQQKNSSVILPVLEKEINIDNNLVNGISTGAGALLAIILKLLLA
jgi:uncharacterized protein (TIGR00297 family)